MLKPKPPGPRKTLHNDVTNIGDNIMIRDSVGSRVKSAGDSDGVYLPLVRPYPYQPRCFAEHPRFT